VGRVVAATPYDRVRVLGASPVAAWRGSGSVALAASG
jgi:hypothetical protein